MPAPRIKPMVEVTQLDRDAAAELYSQSGKSFDDWTAAFARHRAAGVAEGLERAARQCEHEGSDPNWHHMFRQGCAACASAIRTLTEEGQSRG